MTAEELFEKHNDEYLEFERVENPKSRRADMHAFIRLDELFPGNQDMVSAVAHDEIWLVVEPEQVEALDEATVIELTRCGVRYDSESDCLAMFV